jgi:uncharacterized circularly permuted ATP-grasp superfamily protein
MMRGIPVRHKAYVNICGIDLIRDENGGLWVLKDNARTPQAGVVRLTYRDRRSPTQDARSHCRHRIPPFARRFGSKDPQR